MKEYLVDLILNFIGFVFIQIAVYYDRKDKTELLFLSKHYFIALLLILVGGILIDLPWKL